MARRLRAPGARLALRAMSTAPGPSLLVIAVVALIAAVGVAAPALVGAARTATVQAAVTDLPVTSRDLGGSVRGIVAPGGGDGASAERIGAPAALWGGTLDALDRLREKADDEARAALGAPEVFVAVDLMSSGALDRTPRPLNRVNLILDPHQPDRVALVDGREPGADVLPALSRDGAGSDDGAGDGYGAGSGDGAEQAPVGVVPADEPPRLRFEAAMAAGSADELDWAIGETRVLAFSADLHLEVTLTGTFEPIDAHDGAWRHQPLGAVTGAEVDAQGNRILLASLYLSPGALREALPLATRAATTAWLPLRTDAIAAADAADIAAQLRGLAGIATPLSVVAPGMFPQPLQLGSAAPPAIDIGIARADVLSAVVALIAAGPLTVALVALALTARMLAARRIGSVRLAAARGASTGRLVGLLAGEGLGLGVIGAGIGGTAALLLVRAMPIGAAAARMPVGIDALLVPALAAFTPVVVVPVMALRGAARTARADLGLADRRGARRRLALEAVVVVASVAALALLVTRREPSTGPDPLLTIAPLALAAIGCVVALRVLPWVLGLIERYTPRTRGVTALVGPARARRDPAVRTASVLAVVIGVAITIFSAAFTATVREGIEVAAMTRIGADARVQGAYLGTDARAALGRLDGVDEIAAVYADERVEGTLDGSRGLSFVVYVVDATELARVQRDRPGALPVPDALTDIAADRVAVVASEDLAAQVRGGDLEVDGTALDLVAVAPSAGPLGPAQSWVMVDRSQADRLIRPGDSGGVALLRLRPDADPAATAAAAASVVGSDAIATTPSAAVQRLRDDPAYRGVEVALAVAAVVVALLLAFSVAITLVLGSVSRGRLLALLGALGHPRRREWPLVVWEVAPALLLALPVGVAVGLALPPIVLPAIDLTLFSGGAAQPVVHLGGWTPVLVVAGYLAVATIAVVLAAAAAHRITAATTLRSLDEEG